MPLNGRVEADYHVRLVDFVKRWEKANPERIDELKHRAKARMGFPQNGETLGPIHALILDQAYREEVRKEAGKPSLDDWMRGEQ